MSMYACCTCDDGLHGEYDHSPWTPDLGEARDDMAATPVRRVHLIEESIRVLPAAPELSVVA